MPSKEVTFKKFHHDGTLISTKTKAWRENIFEPFWSLAADSGCGFRDHFRYEFEASPETLNYLKAAGRSWHGEVSLSEAGDVCFRGIPIKVNYMATA